MTPSVDSYELPRIPNLKLVRDPHGAAWLCAGGVSGEADLRGQGCLPLDDVIYDRGFGG